jgi:hypothetical protein
MKSHRLWVMWGAALGVVLWFLVTDPDGGLQLRAQLQGLLGIIVATPVVYLLRRALMDQARGHVALQRAMDSPVGAGLVFLGLAVLTGLLFLAVSPRALAAPIQGGALAAPLPAGAVQHLPVLAGEIESAWPSLPLRSVLAAQVEQESRWNPQAKLKTAREYGFGLGQFTIAYRADGSERFNAWREVQDLDPALAGWKWADRYDVRLQLRAVVVKNRACFARLRPLLEDDTNALAMCDAAYNGGLGGLYAERRLCAVAAFCDPDRWFGHVERHSGKSRAKWQGYGKSAFEINREHVRMVLVVRRPKYAAWFGEAA